MDHVDTKSKRSNEEKSALTIQKTTRKIQNTVACSAPCWKSGLLGGQAGRESSKRIENEDI